MTTRVSARELTASSFETADGVPKTPDAQRRLVALLAEQSPLFAGRGTNEVELLRGDLLAEFEKVGLPVEAVPFVLEELESGQTPYTVAAAGRALRGAAVVPAEAPRLLVAAIARLRGGDDVVAFDRSTASPAGGPTTALAELAATLAVLGPRARSALPDLERLVDTEPESFSPAVRVELTRAVEALARHSAPTASCCYANENAAAEARAGAPAVPRRRSVADRQVLEGLLLENQDGTRLTFSEAFVGRPTALGFFYTRCMNPAKCSLTVTRLGRLARRLVAAELDANVAGISYDPGFDRPARLKAYGSDRGLAFSARCSLLRTVGSFDVVRDFFDLGVGYGPVTVNRHRIDVVVLDPSLGTSERFERRLWREDDVLEALRRA